MSIDLALSLALFAAFMVYAARRLLVLLHVFQQEEYDTRNFLLQIVDGLAHGKSWAIWSIYNPFKKAKKPLRMTPRACRIYWLSLVLVLLSAPFMYVSKSWELFAVSLAVYISWMPGFIFLADVFLIPYERWNQRRYWREAHEKLTRLNPVVIGITGSYGKTSVKHILAHILAAHAPTLATPGSVNTPMGITRIIRERLEPRHRYFIVEMGAYGIGSIQRLCELAPPTHAIVTAVGPAHLERFGSLANTATAKAELPAAATGTVVMPHALLEHPPFARLHKSNPCRFVFPENYNTAQAVNGLEVTIDGHTLHAPLYGLHHGDNIALAYTLARALGLDADLIAAALRTVPQIRHRLEGGAYPTGATLIDDAYNANPDGVRAALNLLDFLAKGQKRRILVTPGVVELGAAHDSVHADLGAYAAPRADVVFAVAARRIPTFAQAARAAGAQDVREVARFANAQAWLMANTGPGDVILLANDLPDIYEG